MKELSELQFPTDLRYTKDHEWAKVEGDKIRMGITDYAQDQLGDIVYVEMPEVGDEFSQGEEFGTLESVKAVAPVYLPVSGEIAAVNEALEDSPQLVNQAPYNDGWIVEVTATNPSEWDELKARDAYLEMLKGLQE